MLLTQEAAVQLLGAWEHQLAVCWLQGAIAAALPQPCQVARVLVAWGVAIQVQGAAGHPHGHLQAWRQLKLHIARVAAGPQLAWSAAYTRVYS